MSRLTLDYLEFYISHTCNFNCSGCNRFNNYLFTGHQRWADYQEIHEQWAEKLDLGSYTILGGEPLLNPDIIDWIYGLNKLWPDSRSQITTNASFRRRFDKELYRALVDTQTILQIGLHDIGRWDEVMETVYNFIDKPVNSKRIPEDITELPNFYENWSSSYNKIKAESWPVCNNLDDWESLPDYIKEECENVHQFSPHTIAEQRQGYSIKDSNGLKVVIELENYFHQGALIKQQEKNNFRLHNSDPIKAHDICHSKYCHHMMDGKLSKCGQSVLFQEFSKQFEIELGEQDQELMMSYQPLSVDDGESYVKNFIDNIKNPIDQCKFCPENYIAKEINSSISKDKYGKRVNNGI